MEADRQGFLTTRFGHIRRFYDVFQRRPVADNYQARGNDKILVNGTTGQRWLLRPGDDAEAVTSYRPSADAFGIKRMTMVALRERGWDTRYGLLNEIHDALIFETSEVDRCREDVGGLMIAPSPYLMDPVVAPGGLWCGVSTAVGADMDSFEEL